MNFRNIDINIRDQIWNESQGVWEAYSMSMSSYIADLEEIKRIHIADQIRNQVQVDSIPYEELADILFTDISKEIKDDFHLDTLNEQEQLQLFTHLQFYFPEEDSLEYFLGLVDSKSNENSSQEEPVQDSEDPWTLSADQIISREEEISNDIDDEEIPEDGNIENEYQEEVIESPKQYNKSERNKIEEYIKARPSERQEFELSDSIKEILEKHYD